MPNYTYYKSIIDIQLVFNTRTTIIRHYKIPTEHGTYYAQCKLIPYDDLILCEYTDITERENIKRHLEQANKKMAEMERIAKIGKWTFDVSRQQIINYDFNQQDIPSKNEPVSIDAFLQLIHPDDRNKVAKWIKQSINELKNDQITYRVCYKQHIYHMNSMCIIRTKKKGTTIIEGISQDITDIQRKQSDVDTLTYVIHNLKESIIGIEENGFIKFANQTFRKNYHIGLDEDITKYNIIKLNVGFLNSPEKFETCLKQLQEKKYISYIDDSPFPDNPNILAFSGRLYKITEDNGKYSYWSFAHDITERINYEKEIKRYSLLLNTILDNLPTPITVKDAENDFKYIYCNQAAYKTSSTTGIARELVKNDSDLYSPEIIQYIKAEDTDVLKTGKTHRSIIKNITNNAISYYDNQTIAIKNSSFGTMIINLKNDITQQELLRLDLLNAKIQAEESDRLKTSFLANMSHVVRTPLNAIIGFSNIIAECNNDNERKQYMDIINQNSKLLLDTIDGILELSKIESGTVNLYIEPCRLEDVCSYVYSTCVDICPKQVTFINCNHKGETYFNTDKNKLIELYNLLINCAFKYTITGSILYGFTESEKDIKLYVQTTKTILGIEKIDKLFNFFAIENNYYNMTNMELAICKSLTKLLGGNIETEYQSNKYIKFIISLPKIPNKDLTV